MKKSRLLKMANIVIGFCIATAIALPAQTYTTLLDFGTTNGIYPLAPLVQATDGNFYGTTQGGTFGNGMVFRITAKGRLTTIYNFCAQINCSDGANPAGPLIQATDGNFYGTTVAGGALGAGIVFRITAKGTLTTLYSFCSSASCMDGANPYGGLIQATDGNFYGTTVAGGASTACPGGCGTVFKISPKGRLTTLHSFCSEPDCADGASSSSVLPQSVQGNLVQGTGGPFYGTTVAGGSSNACPGGCGTVYKISSSGRLTTLYSFNGTDGADPEAGLVQATDGDFYGTTMYGGVNDGCEVSRSGPVPGCGTVFRITSKGALTTLYSFCSAAKCADGDTPEAGLVQATDGNFYGTTLDDGPNQAGTIFNVTAAGTLTTIHAFQFVSGGFWPVTDMVQATNGILYGTTSRGDEHDGCARIGCGTVFSLDMGLGPFVKTQTTSGQVGAKVVILGNNLKGTTAVSFNGTSATFKVLSKSEIRTIVPTGATTGPVQVMTPNGTLESNVPFRVTK